MSGLDIAPHDLQPKTFAFDVEHDARAKVIISKYPDSKKQSAVMPLLDLAQRQHGGWIPSAAIEMIADRLEMPSVRVWEVATFYTMYFLAPKGQHKVQVCTTTPCWLRGSDDVVKACKDHLGISFGQVTEDGKFSLHEVECLGACVNAPMIQIDDDYYEDLDETNAKKILNSFLEDNPLKPGSYRNRKNSAPEKNQILTNGHKNA